MITAPANEWKRPADYYEAVKNAWKIAHPGTAGPSRDILRSCWNLHLAIDQAVRYVARYGINSKGR